MNANKGRERDRGRKSISNRLSMGSMEPDVGLYLSPEMMTRAEIKSRLHNQLSHPGTSLGSDFKPNTLLVFYISVWK